ncbi:MAG: TIGR03862 family flavoprotein [Hyphomicrobium sp.]
MVVDGEHGLVVSPAPPGPDPARGVARKGVVIVGAGPAGLMAAEVLAGLGHAVTIYERMPSPARKFLMAGRGGLNLTHSEPRAHFLQRYRDSTGVIAAAVTAYPPEALIAWVESLGIKTFTGSSGRVFPLEMKASPLLRAWLRRLAALGVTLETRHTWQGFDSQGRLLIAGPGGTVATLDAGAVLLTLGGGSWPRLGSDGAWVAPLAAAGVTIAPLVASNCGAEIAWTEMFRAKCEGEALKRIAITCNGMTQRGEAMITRRGLEGGAVYALSSEIREALARGPARVTIDLRPDIAVTELASRLAKAAPKDSLANTLRKAATLSPSAQSLLREAGPPPRDPLALATRIKNVPLTVTALSGTDRAISTAGGITAEALDGTLLLTALPGVFAAGEMLDFDAPTGGYLLQAAFATGTLAAHGIDSWLARAHVNTSQTAAAGR